MNVRRLQEPELRRRALGLIEQYGWNNTSFQTLEPFFEYWFDPQAPAVVAYYRAWGTWVAAGPPVAPPDQVGPSALRFVRAGNDAGYNVCFFGALDRFMAQVGDRGASLKIGEQPWWNPQHWDDSSERRRTIGAQVRRAARLGVTVRALSASEICRPDSDGRTGAQSVIDAWQRSRPMASMSFVVQLDPFSFADQRRYFLAEREGKEGRREAVGFLALVPVYARDGWFLEDLIRHPHAPNGTAEMLVDAAMRGIALEGACYATLGLAPLKGVESAPAPAWARWAFTLSLRYLDPLYSFQGLAAFKSKFRPDGWENVYLTGVPGVTPRMLLSVLAAFARSHPVRFAGITLRRILRRGLHAIRPERWRFLAYAFAGLLLVWIILLRLADSDYWFGAGPARDVWIAFDLIMTGVFVAIGRGAGARSRFVLPLAFTALGAVLTDLFLTATQAFTFHLQHRASLVETILWLVALSGPALAAIFLLGLGVASARWRSHQTNPPSTSE